MSLWYKVEVLKFYTKSYYFNVLRTRKLRQYFIDTTQVTALALGCKIMQHNWWYSTILTANTISNTGKFAKIVHPDFFGEDVGRSSHHSDLENQWRLWWRYWRSEWQTIHSALPYPLYSAFYHYFHSLLPTLINAPPPKHFH